MAEQYGVPVVLHTDHCAKKLLPWMDGMLEASERYFEVRPATAAAPQPHRGPPAPRPAPPEACLSAPRRAVCRRTASRSSLRT